jgi:hypothetical protein
MDRLRRILARTAAYTLALLLSAVWLASALASLRQPLFDLGKAHVGNAILGFADLFALSPSATFKLAHLLANAKLLLGAYLLAAVLVPIWDRLRGRFNDDEMLDLALFVSAIASIAAAAPALQGGEPLVRAIGELLLCALASGLSAYANGTPRAAKPSRSTSWQALRHAEAKLVALRARVRLS